MFLVVWCALQVMAKIEKPQAVNDLEEIVALCDAIMVARYVFDVFIGCVILCFVFVVSFSVEVKQKKVSKREL